MQENRIRTLWKNNQAVINGWIHNPSTWSAELMANQGWDSVVIDMQHGLMGVETAIQMLQAISITDCVPLVRANWNDPSMIMKLIDGGAFGIICPMINTRAECEAFVGACRYPPMGYRSLGPTRVIIYAGSDYVAQANSQIITMAMIETHEAFENREDIMSVEGLDAIFVGPGDLRLTMVGSDNSDAATQKLDEYIMAIVKSAQAHGLPLGIFATSVDLALKYYEMGFRFINVMSDTQLLSTAAKDVIKQVKAKL